MPGMPVLPVFHEFKGPGMAVSRYARYFMTLRGPECGARYGSMAVSRYAGVSGKPIFLGRYHVGEKFFPFLWRGDGTTGWPVWRYGMQNTPKARYIPPTVHTIYLRSENQNMS
jgi:hypothetical protein